MPIARVCARIVVAVAYVRRAGRVPERRAARGLIPTAPHRFAIRGGVRTHDIRGTGLGMSAADRLPSRAWLIVALLWFAAVLDYLDRVALTTMRQSLVADIPMTEAQFGLQTAMFFWVYGVLSPFAGFLADRFSRSLVIIVSLFAWSVVTLATAYATSFNQLLATRFLLGVSQACYYPAAVALIADYHRGATRSLATGVHVTGMTMGGAAAGLGGWLAEHYGWTYAFVLFGVAGIVYSGILALALRDAPRESNGSTSVSITTPTVGFGAAITSLFSSGSYLLAFFFWGLLGIVMGIVAGWMPTYVQEHFHMGQGEAGFTATGYLQVSALVGVLVGGAWADRWSLVNRRARILVTVIGLCFAAPGILLVAHTHVLLVAVFGLILYGFSRSFTDSNLMPILCMVVDPRYRATAYGFLNLFSCILSGVAIYAGGALRDANVSLSRMFLFSAGSIVVCAVLMLLVKPRQAPA